MSDYGHQLEFGLFITPSAQNPKAVVDLAVHAERVGLDLVTFQDHPYQPALLDTWTLMSYVAGATSEITIASNVINLPLRPPAVLARSAAALDILSGGRFELGLGAGGFWDPVVAMGGARRSPGEAIDALREAIAVIRELWDVTQKGGVRFDGTYYQLAGAKRGPQAPHPIGIWLGALKPRMLALTGELADGWLPSVEYLPNGLAGLPEMNEHIDEAAVAAGRPPADVRRFLNVMSASLTDSGGGFLVGPASQWVEQLTEVALEHGVSGVLVGGDNAQVADVLAAEIAPAVREHLARERA